MMTKEIAQALVGHTPGPWEYKDRFSYTLGMVEVSGPRMGVRGFTIATDVTPDQANVTRANARLIAAAPDLLTAYLASEEENERLREALGDIARQRTTAEMPEAERYDADVETGYIECIMRARQALKPKEPKP